MVPRQSLFGLEVEVSVGDRSRRQVVAGDPPAGFAVTLDDVADRTVDSVPHAPAVAAAGERSDLWISHGETLPHPAPTCQTVPADADPHLVGG